jgi:hypothetical protein
MNSDGILVEATPYVGILTVPLPVGSQPADAVH